MPKRIKQRRTKGFRLPENCISVTRSGKWGNPFIIGTGPGQFSREKSLELFSKLFEISNINQLPEEARDSVLKSRFFKYFREKTKYLSLRDMVKGELKGKDLACFCQPDEACHGDVLLKIANEE